jgi:hypothetical protein
VESNSKGIFYKNKKGRATGLFTSCVGTVFEKTRYWRKDRREGQKYWEDAEEDVSSYLTSRK